jgi:cytochrome c-type biogenesis protein
MTVDVMAQVAIGQQFADAAATGPLMIGILAAAAAGLISFASRAWVPVKS